MRPTLHFLLTALGACVAEVSHQVPENSVQNDFNVVPPYYYYRFIGCFEATDANTFSVDASGNLRSLDTCGNILSPGTVVFTNKWGTSHVGLVPIQNDQAVLTASCCPPACPSCISGQSFHCRLEVYRGIKTISGSSDVDYEDGIKFSATCLSCQQIDCGVRTCSDGHYATDYTGMVNGLKFVMNKAECKPCAPGTWLTCTDEPGCEWAIPASSHDPFYNTDRIYSPFANQAPVGGCFPCDTTPGHMHYDKMNEPLKSYIPNNYGKGYKCPGNVYGLSSPQKCPGDLLSSEDYSTCVCQPGYYLTGPETCSSCLVGHMCPHGELLECPDHTYQAYTGATACNLCTSDGTMTGSPMLHCENGNLLAMCIFGFKSRPLQCKTCNQCEKLYAPGIQGTVMCYDA